MNNEKLRNILGGIGAMPNQFAKNMPRIESGKETVVFEKELQDFRQSSAIYAAALRQLAELIY